MQTGFKKFKISSILQRSPCMFDGRFEESPQSIVHPGTSEYFLIIAFALMSGTCE
jgi:hypothetical protein